MNKYVVAIDPSLHSTGIAIFENEKLIHTKQIEVSKKIKGFDALYDMNGKVHIGLTFLDCTECIFVIEEQVRRKGDRMSFEDFVKLASISYLLGCAFSYHDNIVFVKPSTWKGSIPKAIHHKRIRDNELKRGTLLHLYADMQPDIMDAIGIGRWYYASK